MSSESLVNPFRLVLLHGHYSHWEKVSAHVWIITRVRIINRLKCRQGKDGLPIITAEDLSC